MYYYHVAQRNVAKGERVKVMTAGVAAEKVKRENENLRGDNTEVKDFHFHIECDPFVTIDPALNVELVMVCCCVSFVGGDIYRSPERYFISSSLILRVRFDIRCPIR